MCFFIDVDECLVSLCFGSSMCVNVVGFFYCFCFLDREGVYCELGKYRVIVIVNYRCFEK